MDGPLVAPFQDIVVVRVTQSVEESTVFSAWLLEVHRISSDVGVCATGLTVDREIRST